MKFKEVNLILFSFVIDTSILLQLSLLLELKKESIKKWIIFNILFFEIIFISIGIFYYQSKHDFVS